MIEQTIISEDLEQYASKAKYDAACRRLLSNKVLLAWILKGCVEEFQHCDVQEITEKYIEGIPKVSQVPVHHTDKIRKTEDSIRVREKISGLLNEDVSESEGNITFDIHFSVIVPGTKRRVQMQINLEIQRKYFPGYPLPKRGTYYQGRMISSQRGTVFTGSHYEKIKKVYSIWICLEPPKRNRNAITRYSVAEDCLTGNVRNKPNNFDLMSMIMVYLGDYRATDNPLLILLDVLFDDKMKPEDKKHILETQFQIAMTKDVEQEVQTMFDLSEGIEEKAMKKGFKQGRNEERLDSIRNLMKNMNWSMEQAMLALGIPEKERKQCRKFLEN